MKTVLLSLSILAAAVVILVVQTGIGLSVLYRQYWAVQLIDDRGTYEQALANGCYPMGGSAPLKDQVLRCPFWVTP
jgi:hypothetical protein